MKLPTLFTSFALSTLSTFALTACAPQPAPQPAAQPTPQPAAQPAKPTQPAVVAAPLISGPPARNLELPAAAGAGQPREVHLLLDEPALKLVTITLRQGTELPEHHAAVPVLIQALQGAGTVLAGGERLRIDLTHPVLLAPDVAHAVTPDPATDLVLLVQHLGRRASAEP